MGMTATVVGFVRSVVNGANFGRTTIDTGAGANQDTVHYSDPGDDSQPLVTDLVATSSTIETNGQNAVGYLDEKNAGITQAGEKRIYSRDSDGNIVAAVYLKNDGSVTMSNANGTMTLSAGGDFNFTGGSFTINGVVFSAHTHNAGTLQDSTPAPVTGNTGGLT